MNINYFYQLFIVYIIGSQIVSCTMCDYDTTPYSFHNSQTDKLCHNPPYIFCHIQESQNNDCTIIICGDSEIEICNNTEDIEICGNLEIQGKSIEDIQDKKEDAQESTIYNVKNKDCSGNTCDVHCDEGDIVIDAQCTSHEGRINDIHMNDNSGFCSASSEITILEIMCMKFDDKHFREETYVVDRKNICCEKIDNVDEESVLKGLKLNKETYKFYTSSEDCVFILFMFVMCMIICIIIFSIFTVVVCIMYDIINYNTIPHDDVIICNVNCSIQSSKGDIFKDDNVDCESDDD